MRVLAVDLAARYSAACLLDDQRVIKQFDSWGQTEDAFVYHLIAFWQQPDPPAVMIVEDLPHGLSYSKLVKRVLRLQGRIVQAMHETTDGDWNDIVFVAPNTWRSHFDLKRGTGPTAVFAASASLGYQPPDLTERAKGNGGRTRAQKVQSDYCAAYLIGRWAIDTHQQFATFDVPGTSRYDTDVIRKKDFDAQDS